MYNCNIFRRVSLLNVSIKQHFATVIVSIQAIHEIGESWNKCQSETSTLASLLSKFKFYELRSISQQEIYFIIMNAYSSSNESLCAICPGGGVLSGKFGRGVRPASQNPYPIYDQNLWFSLPYLWPDQKFDTLFMT